MTTRFSRILGMLRSQQFPSVLKINLSEPRVVELAAMCGVDAVWLCTEHVLNDWSGIENQIRAARVHNIDSLVRVARGSYSDYIKPFEADATGIIVPHVANAAEARQIVQAVRFHPVGKRAFDGGNTDGRFCLLPMEDYVRHSNTERIVILQIESPEALQEVEAIAAVDGFDGLLFGPGDFSHRVGKVGQVLADDVVSARKRVATAATSNGKFAMSAGLFAPLDALVAEGHSVFGIGSDVVGLGSYVTDRVANFRGLTKSLPAKSGAAASPYA
jgi:4-hydroxy-2-oxoheptanedioate aldolase